MTTEEKILEIKRLAAEKDVTDAQLSDLVAKQKKFDPNKFLDNTLNTLQTLQNINKGVSGALTDKEGNLIGVDIKKERPEQKLKILGMSPPAFFIVSVGVILIVSYGVIKYMKK